MRSKKKNRLKTTVTLSLTISSTHSRGNFRFFWEGRGGGNDECGMMSDEYGKSKISSITTRSLCSLEGTEDTEVSRSLKQALKTWNQRFFSVISVCSVVREFWSLMQDGSVRARHLPPSLFRQISGRNCLEIRNCTPSHRRVGLSHIPTMRCDMRTTQQLSITLPKDCI